MPDNEKQFEQDIESFLISPAGGWQKASDAGYRASMDSGMALDLGTLVGFIKATQPIQWQRFEKQCNSDPEKKFYKAFENAVENDTIMLNYCKKYQVPVVMDSDAHFDLLIGEFDLARALLTKLDFPEDLVLNRSVDAVKKYVNRTF